MQREKKIRKRNNSESSDPKRKNFSMNLNLISQMKTNA